MTKTHCNDAESLPPAAQPKIIVSEKPGALDVPDAAHTAQGFLRNSPASRRQVAAARQTGAAWRASIYALFTTTRLRPIAPESIARMESDKASSASGFSMKFFFVVGYQ